MKAGPYSVSAKVERKRIASELDEAARASVGSLPFGLPLSADDVRRAGALTQLFDLPPCLVSQIAHQRGLCMMAAAWDVEK